MSIPKLVLSNTTTFFSGNIESVFKKAKKHGYRYLEILPYRWTTPKQILKLEQKYQVQVVGLHMPEWWAHSLSHEFKSRKKLIQKLLALVWFCYIGVGSKNPGRKIANKLQELGRKPYLLLHSNLIQEVPHKTLKELISGFFVVVENIPIQEGADKVLWNPKAIKAFLKDFTQNPLLVFDHGHLEESREIKPEIDPVELYKETQPFMIHIGYNDYRPFYHSLPRKQNQEKLIQMLKIHNPEYIVVETNPLVSVRKAKAMMTRIINDSLS